MTTEQQPHVTVTSPTAQVVFIGPAGDPGVVSRAPGGPTFVQLPPGMRCFRLENWRKLAADIEAAIKAVEEAMP